MRHQYAVSVRSTCTLHRSILLSSCGRYWADLVLCMVLAVQRVWYDATPCTCIKAVLCVLCVLCVVCVVCACINSQGRSLFIGLCASPA